MTANGLVAAFTAASCFNINGTDMVNYTGETFTNVGYYRNHFHRLIRTVVSGDISAGVVPVQARFRSQASTSNVLNWLNSNGYVGTLTIKNLGP